MTSPLPDKPFPFVRLPQELQDRVLEEYVLKCGLTYHIYGLPLGDWPVEYRAAAAYNVSRAFRAAYNDCVQLLCKQGLVDFHLTIRSFPVRTSTPPTRAQALPFDCDLIRHCHFTGSLSRSRSQYIGPMLQLLENMPNLQTITICVPAETKIWFGGDSQYYYFIMGVLSRAGEPKYTAARLMEMQLAELTVPNFELPKLKRVELWMWGTMQCLWKKTTDVDGNTSTEMKWFHRECL